VLNSDKEVSFTKSDADAPTEYISLLPQFAASLKEKNRGIVFIGETFVVGLIGNMNHDALHAALEASCKEMSKNKPVKGAKKNEVKFDFKIKG